MANILILGGHGKVALRLTPLLVDRDPAIGSIDAAAGFRTRATPIAEAVRG